MLFKAPAGPTQDVSENLGNKLLRVDRRVQRPAPVSGRPGSTHLSQQLFPVLPPEDDGDHGQQQEDDAHQAANQNGRVAAVVLGDREPRPRSVGVKVRICRRKTKCLIFECVINLPGSACVHGRMRAAS